MSHGAGPTEGEWHRLDPRYLRMAREHAWLRTGGWFVGVALVGTAGWWVADDGPLTRILLVVAGSALVLFVATSSFLLPRIRYRHASWRLDADGLMIRGGAWWRSEVRVPRSRIQHTDVIQGPLQRRHGLGTLVVHTAGTHHGAVTLDGVAHETATTLRDLLGGGDAAQPV